MSVVKIKDKSQIAGLFEGWDAQNPISAALAKKWGYHLEKEYAAYEIKAF